MNSLLFHSFSPLIWSITFLILLNIPTCFSSGLELYKSCGNYFTCGNVTKVGFPFWGGTSRPKNCGYPELELTCESNATTKIEIKDMKYHVFDINQKTQIVKIAREDFVQGLCLQKFTNTTLDFEVFDYALGSQNVTVFYGCPPLYGTVEGQFTCRIYGVNGTDGYPVLGALGPSGCYASVVVPVLGSLAPQIGNLTLDQVIGEGFEAKYKVEDGGVCADCEASKGRCGFDLSTNKTSCLCPDGSVGYAPCSYTEAYAPSGLFSLTILDQKLMFFLFIETANPFQRFGFVNYWF